MHQHISHSHYSKDPRHKKIQQLIWMIAIFLIGGLFWYASGIKSAEDQVQDPFGPTTYQNAIVTRAIDLPSDVQYTTGVRQDIAVRLDDGTEVDIGIQETSAPDVLAEGDKVIVSLTNRIDGSVLYGLVDENRSLALLIVVAIFLAVLLVFAGIYGVTALLGLVFSIAVVGGFIVPQILNGANPMLISAIGAFAIALLSIYLSHGFSIRSSIALVGTLITISLSIGLAYMFVFITGLTGGGSEAAFYLNPTGAADGFNLQGLLLGGIIIGTLGVLDDITTSQAAIVEELHLANKGLALKELYQRGFSVGREHIIALVNTLALAYIGASLPLMILFVTDSRPLWIILNGQFVAEEVVRTLVGSTTLILAVPITTYLAARYFAYRKG